MALYPEICVNNDFPENILAGYDTNGHVIVCIEFEPEYSHLFGTVEDEPFVREWHTSRTHAYRLQAVLNWSLSRFVCHGNA